MTMRPTSILALVLCTSLAVSAAAHDSNPVEAALEAPAATGLLVTTVAAGSQSAAAGIARGDILVTYDGVAAADLEVLAAAKAAAEGKEHVVCVIRKGGGETAEIRLKPGQLGLNLAPVTKGVSAPPLPPDTGAFLDAALCDGRDEWYVFKMNGKHCGFEHIATRTENGVVHVTHEVAFDGAPNFGLNHNVVTASFRCGATVEAQSLQFVAAISGWSASGRLTRDAEGRPAWRVETGLPDDTETSTTSLPADLSPVPTYLVSEIARLLPQTEGACFRFRPMGDTDGVVSLRAALVCEGAEALTIGEKTVATTRYVQRQLGGATLSTFWFDSQRNMVRADFGGAIATLATKAEALAGLNPELKPRTAD
jgi:hypothetical protein